MLTGCLNEPVEDVTPPIDHHLRVTHFIAELDVVIDQVISRPQVEFREHWIERFNRMESGEDEVSDAEREMYEAKHETHRLAEIDDCE